MIRILRAGTYNLLRKSEKYTKTDMVYFAKGSFWMNSGQIITAIITFLLSIAFANLLLKEIYGTYKYILSIAGLFGVISLSGMGTAITRAVAKGFEGEFVRGVKINLKWEILIFLAASIGAIYYFINGDNNLAIGLLIVGVFSPLLDSTELYGAFLGGKKDFKELGKFTVIRFLVCAIWIFITLNLTKNPIYLVLSYFFIHTAVVSCIYLYVLKTKKPNNNTDNETLNLAKHTSFINNLSGLADQIDNILIFHYWGAASLAIYNFAQAIPEHLTSYIKSIGGLAMPKFVNRDKETIKSTMLMKSMQIFVIGLCMAIIYVLISPIIFKVFFPQYISSLKLSQIYALILIIPGIIPAAFLDSQAAIKHKYWLNITSSIMKIAIITFGIVYYGIWGAILGRVISKLLVVLNGFYIAYKV